jgi:hypothetical protein
MQNPKLSNMKNILALLSAMNKKTATFRQCLIVGPRAKVPLKQADEVR